LWEKKVGNWKPPEGKKTKTARVREIQLVLVEKKINIGNRKPLVHEVGLEDASQQTMKTDHFN
jgi:hypothetical protein